MAAQTPVTLGQLLRVDDDALQQLVAESGETPLSMVHKSGVHVVHQELLRRATLCESVTEIAFFYQPPIETAGISARLAQLFAPKPTELRSVFELREHMRGRKCVFPVSQFHQLQRLALVRRRTGLTFSICTIVHSVPLPWSAALFWPLLFLSQPYDALVVSSDAAARCVTRLFDASTTFFAGKFKSASPPPRVARIPLALDTGFLRPRDPTEARLTLGLRREDIVLLYVGRLSQKFKADLDPLLAVFRELSERYPELRLLIAGKEGEEAYGQTLRNHADSFGVGDRVVVVADFPAMLKPALYAAADVAVSPVDNIQETFGLSILEAMSCAVPVVASEWSGYRELVDDGISGFLIPTLWCGAAASEASELDAILDWPGAEFYLAQHTAVDTRVMKEQLEALITNPLRRKGMGEEGRRRAVARYSWPDVIRQHENLWLDLASGQPSQPDAHPLPSWIPDYDELFSHMATRALTNDMNVGLPRDGLRRIAQGDSTFGTTSVEVQRVVEYCTGRKTRVGELIDAGVASSIKSLAWMLKKGYIERVP